MARARSHYIPPRRRARKITTPANRETTRDAPLSTYGRARTQARAASAASCTVRSGLRCASLGRTYASYSARASDSGAALPPAAAPAVAASSNASASWCHCARAERSEKELMARKVGARRGLRREGRRARALARSECAVRRAGAGAGARLRAARGATRPFFLEQRATHQRTMAGSAFTSRAAELARAVLFKP